MPNTISIFLCFLFQLQLFEKLKDVKSPKGYTLSNTIMTGKSSDATQIINDTHREYEQYCSAQHLSQQSYGIIDTIACFNSAHDLILECRNHATCLTDDRIHLKN